MTGATIINGEDNQNLQCPSTFLTDSNTINFSGRNTVPSESDLILNSSQALKNEGFKKKAILEWKISPIKQQQQQPQKEQSQQLNTCQHILEQSKKDVALNNKYKFQQNQKQFGQQQTNIEVVYNDENHQKGQGQKRSSLQVQNKILSKILKKSTYNHMNEFNKQLQSKAGGSITLKEANRQTTLQSTETTNQFVSQEFLRQRTNTEDFFYFSNTCTHANIGSKQTLLSNQTEEKVNKINYLPLKQLIASTNELTHMTKYSLDLLQMSAQNKQQQQSNTQNQQSTTQNQQSSAQNKQSSGHRTTNSFYNLLSKIQNNVEQNSQSKREHRVSIKPSLTTKIVLSDRHFDHAYQNVHSKQPQDTFPQSTYQYPKKTQQQLTDTHQFTDKPKFDNFLKDSNSLNIPLQLLSQKQLQKNTQYFFPSEVDMDSTPFSIPKNQFQYHYRDNSYQLIQNEQNDEIHPSQIASTRSQDTYKQLDSEHCLGGSGRQRSNAYSSLAGNLDEIYKKLQNLKQIQNVQCY